MYGKYFLKGNKAKANFTGTAYVNLLVPDKDKQYNCQVYDVVFEAGRPTAKPRKEGRIIRMR